MTLGSPGVEEGQVGGKMEVTGGGRERQVKEKVKEWKNR